MSKQKIEVIEQKDITNQEMSLIDEIDYAEDAGLGLENATSDCFAQPFLQILQPLSKICLAENKPVNAAPGKIYDPLSGAIYDAIEVIPCYFERQYVEWKPQGQPNPLVAVHKNMPETAIREGYKIAMPNGNLVKDTRVYYVLVLTEDWFYPALICMSSTQIKVSDRWNTMMSMLKPIIVVKDGVRRVLKKASFSKIYRLSTHREPNSSHVFHGWKVEFSPREMTTDYYASAKAFHEQCKTIAPPTQDIMTSQIEDTATQTDANDFEDVEM